MDSTLLAAVEALIFAADAPAPPDRIARIIGEVTLKKAPSVQVIKEAVVRLNECYAQHGHALQIQFWAGGYRMATSEVVAPFLRAYFRSDRARKLTRPLMETLAIICYRQPATKPEIDQIRGVDSDYALRRLMDAGFIDVAGRAEAVGRPVLYATTGRFLEAFGLADLSDLPNLREIEELLGDPLFSQEKARLLMLKGFSSDRDRVR